MTMLRKTGKNEKTVGNVVSRYMIRNGNVVDFETIRQIVHAGPSFVGMCNYHNLMTSIYQFRSQLIDVTFDSAWLGKEEVADHCNVVRHPGKALRPALSRASVQSVSIMVDPIWRPPLESAHQRSVRSLEESSPES